MVRPVVEFYFKNRKAGEILIYTVFSSRLTKLRKERGINQKQCAEILEIESSKYNKWENGKNRPSYDIVCKLANFFDTTTDYLLGNSDKRYKNEYKNFDNRKKEFMAEIGDKLLIFLKNI